MHFIWLHIVFRKTLKVIPCEKCSDSKRKEKEVEQVVKKGNTVGEEGRVEGERRRGERNQDTEGRWEDMPGSSFLHVIGLGNFIYFQVISPHLWPSEPTTGQSNSCQLDRVREKAKEMVGEWAQRWPKHISRENQPHPWGITLPTALTSSTFFWPAQHAIKQESKHWHCLSDESVCCTSLDIFHPFLYLSSPLITPHHLPCKKN